MRVGPQHVGQVLCECASRRQEDNGRQDLGQVPSWLLNRSRASRALLHRESNRAWFRCPNIAKDLTLAVFKPAHLGLLPESEACTKQDSICLVAHMNLVMAADQPHFTLADIPLAKMRIRSTAATAMASNNDGLMVPWTDAANAETGGGPRSATARIRLSAAPVLAKDQAS